jgi:hypothetical protein
VRSYRAEHSASRLEPRGNTDILQAASRATPLRCPYTCSIYDAFISIVHTPSSCPVICGASPGEPQANPTGPDQARQSPRPSCDAPKAWRAGLMWRVNLDLASPQPLFSPDSSITTSSRIITIEFLLADLERLPHRHTKTRVQHTPPPVGQVSTSRSGKQWQEQYQLQSP